MKSNKIFVELVCGLLILLFMYAGLTKVIAFKTTLHEINNQVLPDWATPYLAVGIPLIELLIVIGLLTERFKIAALYASLGLMTVFTIYIGLALLNVYSRMPCSCGGVLKKMGWETHFFFNLFYVSITILALWVNKKIKKEEGESRSSIQYANI